MAADAFAGLVAEYYARVGHAPPAEDAKGCVPLPKAGPYSLALSRHSARPGHCALYSRDVQPIPRDVVERVCTLKTLLKDTIDNWHGVIYTLAGGMPYACLHLHTATATAVDLEEARDHLLAMLDSDRNTPQPPIHLGAATQEYVGECLTLMLKRPAELDPVTKTIQLMAGDQEFWLCPSYRGHDYVRIMAVLPWRTIARGTVPEWPLWHLLRTNEVNDFAVGISGDLAVMFRDLRQREVPPQGFQAWVSRFVAATRALQGALESGDLDLGQCLLEGPPSASPPFHVQYWFHCKDCRLESSVGVCLPCAHRCHAGHQLQMCAPSAFFCDCPAASCCVFHPAEALADRLNLSAALDLEEASDVALLLDDGSRLRCHRALVCRSPGLAARLPAAPADGASGVVCCLPVVSKAMTAMALRRLYGGGDSLTDDAQQLNALLGDGEPLPPLAQWTGALLRDALFSDIVVEASGMEFPAHRVILAARSEYWRRLLQSGMQEARDAPVVPLGDGTAPPPVAAALLAYLYTEQLPLGDVGHLSALYCLARELVLEDLAYRCEVLLCRQVDEASAADLLDVCQQHGSHTVAEACIDRLASLLPDDPDSPRRRVVYDAYCRRCARMLLKADFDSVLPLASAATALWPTGGRAAALQAMAHLCLEAPGPAAECLARALAPGVELHRDVLVYASMFSFVLDEPHAALQLLGMAQRLLPHLMEQQEENTHAPRPTVGTGEDHTLANNLVELASALMECATVTDSDSNQREGGVAEAADHSTTTGPMLGFLRAAYEGDVERVNGSVWNCPLMTLCQGVAQERAGRLAAAQSTFARAVATGSPLPFPLAHTAYRRTSPPSQSH